MTSTQEMRYVIQEWMAQELDAVSLTQTYSEIKEELNRQLEYCMSAFTKAKENG